MKKITKKDIENLAGEIVAFLKAYDIADGVSIYYNGDVIRSKTEYKNNGEYSYSWVKTEIICFADGF